MRNISSSVLALAAMVLSSFTTYLTFFDSRYTLTAAVAKVTGQVSRGYGSNSDSKSVNYRFFTDTDMVLSNRGTRSLVVSDIHAVKSSNPEKCEAEKDAERIRVQEYTADGRSTVWIKPFIVEPGSISARTLWVNPSAIDQEVKPDESFELSPISDLWCLEWKIFDPNGKKHENLMPAFELSVEFENKEGESSPIANMRLKDKSGPKELLKRGLF